MKLQTFSFLSKNFNFYRQLAERWWEGREETAFPLAAKDFTQPPAPLTRRKARTPPPARLARRWHRAAAPPAPESACLPAEVLKLLTFSFLQSNSNFIVSLSNLCKRCEGATVPAAEPHFANLPAVPCTAAHRHPSAPAPTVPRPCHAPSPHPTPPSPRRDFETAGFQFLCKVFQTLWSAYRT